MDYIERALERRFLCMTSLYKVILVTGARHVGKTTMLKHLAEGHRRTYVSLDNTMARILAKTDPEAFFRTYRPPVIIAEIQKAPELLPQIKNMCAEPGKNGMFWLTASHRTKLMKAVQESLGDQIGILELYGLSRKEIAGSLLLKELDLSLSGLIERQLLLRRGARIDIAERIWRGGMPAILQAGRRQRQEYFDLYLETQIMRDVAEEGGITDTVRFRKFLNACTTSIAEQINYKVLADAAEISQPTAKEWVRILQSAGILCLFPVYESRQLKNLTKTPKLYFCDTGLCAYLSMTINKEALKCRPDYGRYLENYVVAGLLKELACSASNASLYHYRDFSAREIDVFLEKDGVIHPLEIALSPKPDPLLVKKYELLDRAQLAHGNGGIICTCTDPIPIDKKNCYIPCSLI